MSDKIIASIQEKFIENLPEGLFLRDDMEYSILPDEDHEFYQKNFKSITRSENWKEREKISLPDKSNPIRYLTALLLKTRSGGGKMKGVPALDFPPYDAKFDELLASYWSTDISKLSDILQKAEEIVASESISSNDLVFINVGYRTHSTSGHKTENHYTIINNNQTSKYTKTADCKRISETIVNVFIIKDQFFIKISIGPNGVLDHSKHIIQKDIKKLSIADNVKLEIYFHGYYDPEVIVLDDYKSAVMLQDKLTELRQLKR